jgi:hypothetical protein
MVKQSGSGRPESKQVKKIGSDGSKLNVPYFNQQQSPPPTGPTKRHPLQVQKLVDDGQQQQLQDKGGQ